jgi:putative oxygen-independent coproporphyrinogen III oxidase
MEDQDNSAVYSVYVHIPFCSHRCDYCDFATWVDKEDMIDKYVDTVINQWNYHVQNQPGIVGKKLRSIFFGGGTPNLIDPKHIVHIIEAIKNSSGSIADDCEITVESNPDQITLEQMQTYKIGGVNRISVGVQSTNQDVLDYLGRKHEASKIREAIDCIIGAGITNFSCDLIYGSGNETLKTFEKSLRDTMELNPNHISAYSLGVEKGTPLFKSISLGLKQDVDEDDLADKYELADKVLGEQNYNWYEISNWAKPGFESKHNLSYWRGIDVIALGCAAHGHTNKQRWATPRDIDRYVERFSIDISKSNFEDIYAVIVPNKTIGIDLESFALKLRTRTGIVWPKDKFDDNLQKFIENEFCQYDEETNSIYLTLKGRLLAHSITIELFESYTRI